MGILVIVTVTILKSFWIVIRHRSNSNSELFFLLSVLYPFNIFVCLYLLVLLALFECFFLLFRANKFSLNSTHFSYPFSDI
jgi:hypothetical protein